MNSLAFNADSSASSKEFFLTRVEYFEEKKQIVCEFQNSEEKQSERFVFFPKLFSSVKKTSGKLAAEILKLYDEKRFRSEVKQNVFCVQAATFTDLKKIARLLKQGLGLESLLLEPERQFLIEKNWGFFDCFKHSKKSFEKIECLKVPEAKTECFSTGITETLGELIEKDRKTALKFMREIALSNVLKIPLGETPRQDSLQAEIMLENLLFKNGFAVEKNNSASSKENSARIKGFFKQLVELDFSRLWNLLFTSEYYNLGFESLNCKCCKPESIFEKNILPNSKIQVQFLREGFYFETPHFEFALEFHEKNKGKAERLKRKKEWFLPFLPAGPFEKNQKAVIPLTDALKLESEGSVKILKEKKLKWHCLRKESFLSKEMKELNSRILKTEELISGLELKALKEFKVLGFFHAFRNLNHLYLLKFKETLERILGEIPKQLLSKTSRNYFPQLAESLKALQGEKVREFKSIGKANGVKIISQNDYSVFMQGSSAMTALKEFSEKSRLKPAVLEIHRQKSF